VAKHPRPHRSTISSGLAAVSTATKRRLDVVIYTEDVELFS
jgi:hypothetical protein